MRQSCETHVTNAELARRRQAFYLCKQNRQQMFYAALKNITISTHNCIFFPAQVNRVPRDTRVVRVATIERDSNHVAYEVYEIQFPPNSRPRAVLGVSTGQTNQTGQQQQPRRHHHRARRARNHPELQTPPPPFRTALEQSLPVPHCYSQQIELEEPPPSYDDYVKQIEDNSLETTDTGKGSGVERY